MPDKNDKTHSQTIRDLIHVGPEITDIKTRITAALEGIAKGFLQAHAAGDQTRIKAYAEDLKRNAHEHAGLIAIPTGKGGAAA